MRVRFELVSIVRTVRHGEIRYVERHIGKSISLTLTMGDSIIR
jgi:hypothetical protein